MKRLIVAAIAALSLNLAYALEMEGAKFDDKTKVGSGDVVLNGAGVRSKFGKRYVMALYLPAKTGDAGAAVSAKGAKRVSLFLLKDGDGKTFAGALPKAMGDNNSEAEMGAVKGQIKQFTDTMEPLGDIKAGSTILFDWIPEKGTVISVNGQAKGKEIAGEDFYKALLKAWLGNDPVQGDLKSALLGK